MFLIFFLISVAIANILNTSQDSSINQCLDEIALMYFKHNDLIFYSTQNIRLSVAIPVLTLNRNIRFYLKRFDVYVIEVQHYKDLLDQFNYLSLMKTWSSRAKFIILIHNYDDIIFYILAKYNIYDVIVINLDNSSAYDIVTYFPFDANSDGNNRKMQPTKIGLCNNGIVVNITELFVNKLPVIWANTTITAKYLLFPPYVMYLDGKLTGLEIQIVNLIADQMGFKINFQQNKGYGWGFILPNGTYTSALGDLQSKKCELVIGLFPGNDSFAKDFDMSFNYLDDYLVWVVPRARLLQTWAKLIRIFNFQSWMMIFVMLIVIILTFYTISYQTANRISLWNSFETTYSILLASAAFREPRYFRVRIIFISWCIFAMTLKADFDASFISTLMTNSYETQLKTQEDMISAKLGLGYLFIVQEYYNYTYNSKDVYIQEHAEECMFNSACLDRVAFRRDFATASILRHVNYLIDLYYISPEGNPMIYVVKDEVNRIMAFFYMEKGHPIFPQFDRTLIYAKSSGFFVYWESMLTYTIKLKHNKLLRASSLSGSQGFKLSQLFSSFVFLFMGLTLSIFVFCFEVLWTKLQN